MSLSRCQLFEAGFLANNLHLHDPNCNGTVQDGRLVFHFDNDDHICGTNLTANGTHFIYENIIQGEVGSTTGSIHRNKTLELSFSCIYKLSESLSMDREINPIQSIVHKTLPGKEGMYRIKMIPYEDSSFSHPYNGRVNIEVGEQIYIGVFVQGVDSCQLATVIDSCWATPVNQRNYSVRCDLITGNCPNPNDATVKILENGVSTTGRFSFKMFSFNEDESRVFLHCSIHLCLLINHNCAPRCFPGYHHRSGRSLGTHDSASISMGPFIRAPQKRGKNS
ncbi:alpha-tectorin [Tachysurus vachellii]|uniref:alpha-tectorin n=1 Tax=Tachysurus vachellii TaxID=175792 RepID=UPI00296AB814|nr:alpha-tectorin [Tachysurus vachellii]